MKKISLTGIKPTGKLHIGNYLGAIKPALELAQRDDARYFIADYHALNSVKNAAELRASVREVAAGWLACGLDCDSVVFYRQSLVPETFELATLLMAFTSKGLMNRAHAYKAAVDANAARGAEPDAGINMGLFTYPVLMAADILLFDADVVPVGADQTQHVEMARDIAESFNFIYKAPLLKVPQVRVNEDRALVPGLDGRKMSKSYGNVIPLFLPEADLRKLIMRMVTNSQGVDEPKDPSASQVFQLYRLFADAAEQEREAARYAAGGMGWGDAKAELFRVINRELSPLRERYAALMAAPESIDRVLAEGSEKARRVAAQTMRRLRAAIGIADS
ncbi:MAG: tryptophan--tRNA ligase [Spirochaetaceae bacterium]|jgi:tryptophanyl-tRNA synthetase|nr:tryptophan--tRNA ligase [Spirochaetaceae bacterium]